MKIDTKRSLESPQRVVAVTTVSEERKVKLKIRIMLLIDI